MSYYAKFSISAECPDKAAAEMLADEFRDAICASDEVDVSGSTVCISCYKDINNEFFGELTAKYPGTFIAAEYYGEDEETGIIYAKGGKFYTDFAEVKFPEFDERKLPVSDEAPRNKQAGRVICQSFSCNDDLTQYVDSMLFDSGTSIAQAEYKAGDKTLRVSLEVRGEVAVEFKGITYRAPSEFPDELIERIKRNPGWWNTCAPSGEGTDEPELDVYIGMNNWFEAIWDYCGYSDGVMYEADLANSSKDEVKEFLDEVAKYVIGENDIDILKSKTLKDVEELGWSVHEDKDGIEFSQYSPAGEDFSIYVNTGRLSVISEAVKEYYEGFDPEEHALMAFKMRGAPGLRECLDDAESIDAMLNDLSCFLNQAVEVWCEEYGIDDRSV